MDLNLSSDAADNCVTSLDRFVGGLRSALKPSGIESYAASSASFETARQIAAVHSVFAGEDLRTLLNGFVVQAEAMSVLFAVAGGLIEAQDESVAAALGKAAEEPAGLQSIGLINSLASLRGPVASAAAAAAAAGGSPDRPAVGGYGRVGPEDVSTTPLERIVTAAQALDPGQFAQVKQQVTTAADTLDTAATALRSELGNILGSSWQGEFAQQGSAMTDAFTKSAFDLVTVLEQVANRADYAHNGFGTTRDSIAAESAKLTISQALTPGVGTGPGATLGPASPGAVEAAEAARAAAEEQARAVVNTEYSPAVMAANLDDLDFPTAFRVVSSTALDRPGGIDPLSSWNTGGIPRTAGASPPGPAALEAAGLVPGSAGTGTGGAGRELHPPTGTPTAMTDAATQQALLASRASAADAQGLAGPLTAGGTTSPGSAPLNAATTAAGAPMAPVLGAAGQQANGTRAGGSGTAGIRGLRGTSATRNRDRGFGSAAGLIGGGGAAAAGSGASRMGGAGTLAGLGTPAGPGGTPTGGLPGAGAGTGSGAPAGSTGTGPTSPSSSTTANSARPGAMPMGMMGAGAPGHGSDRRGHTPAGYLTNATNTTDIIGEPVKVAPSVLGRAPAPTPAPAPAPASDDSAPPAGRILGRALTGGGAPA